MAVCATHSSLMIAYAASKDLTIPSLFSSANPRPNKLSVALYPPLVLLAGRRASNPSFPVVVSAVAAEADVDTEDAEQNEATSTTATAVLDPPKPKKGKAALLLKRDRVCFAYPSFPLQSQALNMIFFSFYDDDDSFMFVCLLLSFGRQGLRGFWKSKS